MVQLPKSGLEMSNVPIAGYTTRTAPNARRGNIIWHMTPMFIRLNNGWNAEPNAPAEAARVAGQDILLEFDLNAFQFGEFSQCEKGVLRFVNCSRYRLGETNDEGWYRGQCRFSSVAPAWGEFYAIIGDPNSTDGPDDWVVVQNSDAQNRTHFLFYFRDRTFECVAQKCEIEPIQQNALFRTLKTISRF